MEIQKTTTKTYKVSQIVRNFCKFDEDFKRFRLKFHRDKSMKCFGCGDPFENGDNINIYFMAKDDNKLCCDKCANESEPKRD